MLQTFNQGLDSFISMEQLATMCPVAFKSLPTNPALSEHYTQVNTSTVLEDLAKLNWFPVTATMRKNRKPDTIFSAHMVSLQNSDLVIKGANGDDAFVRIILQNSHDGFSSFKFSVGLYRLICSNGLIISTAEFSNYKIKHIGYSFKELQNVINQVVSDLPNHIETLNHMQDIILTPAEQHSLALQALKLRVGIKPEEAMEYEEETIEEMLLPLREMDEGDNLWLVLNRIQERIIRGGFRAAINGKKPRMFKPIKSFETDLKLNKDLFLLASNMISA